MTADVVIDRYICIIKLVLYFLVFFFSSRRRHTRLVSDWSSDVCSSDLQDRPVHATTPAFNNREYLAGEQPAQPLANEVPGCRLKFFSGQPHSCLPNSDISEHWDAETNLNLYPRASPSLRLLRRTLASLHHKGGFATRRLVSIAEC